MSLPTFSTQGELFSTAGLSTHLFPEDDRYRLFGQFVFPELVRTRPVLAACYCANNGRVALEPVLLQGVTCLQFLDGVPDRQAVEMLRYHAGWNFALNRQLGDPVFHPTSLVYFRDRLEAHGQSALGFAALVKALERAGLVSRQSRQRLDSTGMHAAVARMNRLDCVRESLRLALVELEGVVEAAARPGGWSRLWERYVEGRVDYRADAETLGRKLGEAGRDAWELLEWLGGGAPEECARGAQVQLLRRVFGEQFEVEAGQPVPLAKEKVSVAPSEVATAGENGVGGSEARGAVSASSSEGMATAAVGAPPAQDAASSDRGPEAPAVLSAPEETAVGISAGPAVAKATSGDLAGPEDGAGSVASSGGPPAEAGRAACGWSAEGVTPSVIIRPKGKGELDSDRVQNPHDPEATYAVKGQGQQKKEHVGYKVQVAETVSEVKLAPGEPTHNFIVGIETHPAHQSDEAGEEQVAAAQAAMGWEKPPTQYVDGAYVSAQKLAEAQAEGRELVGPAQPAPQKEGRFSVADFTITVEERKAVCPAGRSNTQCSRLVEEGTGKVSYRFEFSTQCQDCALRGQCLGEGQRHRTVVVGEYHSHLQARRLEQQTSAFQERMKHRNGIEGTQSELVRGHGLRRARYRGLARVKLQNYFIGAACNLKRWIRLEAWQRRQAALAALAGAAATAAG